MAYAKQISAWCDARNRRPRESSPLPAKEFPALINCPDCKGRISRIADFCPHCGRPTEHKRTVAQFKGTLKNNEERTDHYDLKKRVNRMLGGK